MRSVLLGAALVAACARDGGEDDERDRDVVVEAFPEVGTVFRATWSTPAPATGWVEWGPTVAYGRRTPAGDRGTEHVATVFGAPPGTMVHWRTVAEDDGERWEGPDQAIVTAVAPADVPDGELVAGEDVGPGPADEAGGPWALVPWSGGEDASGVVAYDAEGDAVWWVDAEDGTLVSRIRVLGDGRIAWDERVHEDPTATPHIVVRRLDGTEEARIPVPEAHHDFLPHPDGGWIYLARDRRWVDEIGDYAIGDALVRMDADGATTTLWNAWDEFAFDPGLAEEAYYPDGRDWTHCNGIDLDPETGRTLLSCRNLDALLALEPDGEVAWRLGGQGMTLGPFGGIHAPVWGEGDAVWLFENGYAARRSSLVELDVDALSGVTTERWSASPETWYAPNHGNVLPLADGGALGCWGALPRLARLSVGGEVVWQLDVDAPGLAYAALLGAADLGGG